MRFLVKPLRKNGVRLSDQQIASLVPLEGDVTVYGLGTTTQATLREPNNHVSPPLLPDIYDARLKTMGNDRMLIWGIQRTEHPGDGQHLQEWSLQHVPIIVDADGSPAPGKPWPR